jgi:hypothetical protein
MCDMMHRIDRQAKVDNVASVADLATSVVVGLVRVSPRGVPAAIKPVSAGLAWNARNPQHDQVPGEA